MIFFYEGYKSDEVSPLIVKMRAWILLLTLAVLLVSVAEGYRKRRWDGDGIHRKHYGISRVHRRRHRPHHQYIQPRGEEEAIEDLDQRGFLKRTKDKKDEKHPNSIFKSRPKKKRTIQQKIKAKIAKAAMKAALNG